MKFRIDHDLHIHSLLSECSSDPEQTTENILKYAAQMLLTRIFHMSQSQWLELKETLEIIYSSLPKMPIFWLSRHMDSVASILQISRRYLIQHAKACHTPKTLSITERKSKPFPTHFCWVFPCILDLRSLKHFDIAWFFLIVIF